MLITAGSIAWLLAGSFSTTVPVDESALSAARTCGMWSLRDNIGRESESRDDLFQAQKEARAGQYGKECYVDASVLSPDHCNFFDTQSIPSHVHFNQKCPFQDSSFCTGNYTAAVFTTGLEGSDGFVDASTLGLNSPLRPKFRKTTTCVPLNMRQGFIRKLLPDSVHVDYQFEYYLGPVNDSASGFSANYTFKMFGDPYRWEIPAYFAM